MPNSAFDKVNLNGEVLDVRDSAARAEATRINQTVNTMGQTVSTHTREINDINVSVASLNGTVNTLTEKVNNISRNDRFSKVRIYFEDTAGKTNAANKIKQMLGLSDSNCVLIPCRNCAIGTTASDTTFADVIRSEGGGPDVYVNDPTVSDIIILCGYPDIWNDAGIAAGASALMAARDMCYSNALIACAGVDWAATSNNRATFNYVYNSFKNNLNGNRCYFFDEFYVLCHKDYLEANDAFKAFAGEYVGRYVGNHLLGGDGYELVNAYYYNKTDPNNHAFVEEFGYANFVITHNPHTYEIPSGTIIAPDTNITFDVLDNEVLTAALGLTNIADAMVSITPTGGNAIVAYATIIFNKVGSDVVLQVRLPSRLGFSGTYNDGGTIYVPGFRALIPIYRI